MAYRYRSGAGPGPEEQQARDRILDAAIRVFGERGFTTTLKVIAAEAGVSAPLVIHHFGSKAGLRSACDAEVARVFRTLKSDAVARGAELTMFETLVQFQQSRPLLRYLFHSIRDGGVEMDRLIDQLVEDSLEYTADAESRGLVRGSVHPRNRAIMLILMSFGALSMHDQVKRLIGVSPVDDPPEDWGPYVAAVSEIFLYGVLRPEAYEELVLLVEHHRDPASTEARPPGEDPSP